MSSALPASPSVPTEGRFPAIRQSSAAKAPVSPKKRAGEGGDLPHAYVENGDLFILDGGVYWRFDSLAAWCRWCEAAQSPYPSTQERARQIRAAMDEAFPQERAA